MLNKDTFKSSLKAQLAGINPQDGNVSEIIADAICDAVDDYIRSATITVETAISGVCDTQAGTITGTGSGTAEIS
jgi:hypothetical protein